MLNRPWSFEHPAWITHHDYIQIDKVSARHWRHGFLPPALPRSIHPCPATPPAEQLYGDLGDAFVVSQSWMNVIEIGINLLALALLRAGRVRAAAVAALVVSTMTCSKTVLYHIQESVNSFR